MFGGYAGFGAADPDARDLGRYPTILSGDIGVIGVSTDNSYHVVTGSGTDTSDILDGFTITGGYADASGGGMYNVSGSPTIRNCNFIGNRADRSGGGMYNSGSSPTLVNCTFTANVAAGSASTMSDPSAARSGGGIENASGSSPTLINCTFVANSVRSGNVPSGNAINSVNSLPTLVNCIVWGSASDGALIGGPANITYSDIQGGWAGVGNINVDPQFVRVPSPGFDEVWGTADDCPGDVRLRLDSPAIDAGTTAAVPAGTRIDVAGNSRFQDISAVPDTGVGSAPIVDMGAYEAVPALMAAAGGPYTVLLGNTIRLSGAGYSESGLALSYAWDLNSDGVFDDALTPDPLFTATAGGMHYVAVRVSDANGIVAIDRAGVWVERMIYVDDSAMGANTGIGWADAFTSLQSALANANPGDVIRVAGGTYKPTENDDHSATFQLKNGVSVYGGYAGYGATDPDTRDTARYPTVLSGDIGVVGVMGDNSLNVVTAIDVNGTVILDGFTITAGNSNSNGGGLYCQYATPTVRNCRFVDNVASASGGGLYASASYLTLINCEFIRNIAQTGGGMALANHSNATLTNCQVNGNTAHEGGGIEAASDSWPTLVNCTFIGNSAAGSGGAIYCDIASVKLINCTLTANRAANGGAFKSNGRKSAAYNCILWADVAPTDPEYYYHDGTLEIDHCVVQDGHVGMNADPLFVRVPSPGVDAIWGTADDDYGDLRLRLQSRAIDAGSNSWLPADVTTDLAGGPRFSDLLSVPDIGSGTPPIVDMGAYEAQPTFQASAGGPYAILQGATLKLSGSGFSDLGLPLTYAWDLDGDGIFDDASVPDPVFSAVDLQGPLTINIALRVVDADGAVAIDRATLNVVPPIYVDDSATGANNGTSWADAYSSLQSALVAATAGQVIYVAQGTYMPTAGADRSATLHLKNQVAIYGGYAGYGAADPDARDIGRYTTILSGDIGTVGSNGDNSYHVVTGSGTDSTAVLDGFTITGGNANGASPDNQGGGMYNWIGSPTVRNCTIRDNRAGDVALDSGGGGVCNDLSSPTFVNCIFTGNSAAASDSKYPGGAMLSRQSMPTLIDCSFTFNSAGRGGALSGPAQLIDCTFIGNSAEDSGGGMYAFAGTTLTNCIFVANIAGTGGALSGSAQMINCTLANNFASYQGGAIEVGYGGTVGASNCIIWGNNAPRDARFYLQGSLNASYSDIQGGWGGLGNIDVDPLFFRNPNAGPDTTWGTADDDYGDLRLRLASPAIDAGDNSAFPTSPTTDLAGNPRFQDIASVPDTGSGTVPIIDMGAYEAAPAPRLYAYAGGPYYVLQGESVKLAGSGSSDLGLALSYAWDFDGDGLFDDAAKPDPLFSSGGLRGPGTLNIALQVTDTQGNSAIDRTVIRVVPPIYVDDSATGANNGTSWADAYTTLQSALAAATAGQVIYVAQGTYKPTGGADRSATFQLKNNVALLGGYAGVGAADPDARNIGSYPSILSGDLGGLYYNTYHVVTGSNTDSTAVLDGFTIRGGSGNQGGGMYNNMGNPTIRDCVFADNTAGGDYDAGGGGMYNLYSSPTLIRCRFLRNSVTYRNSGGGGAMFNVQSSPTLIDCEFDGNWAGQLINYVPSGGAIFNWSSAPLLINCSFVGNAVYGSGDGGALYNRASTATLVNCTFVANVAGNASGYGSVLACDTSSAKMVNCVIWGNVGSEWLQNYLAAPIDISYSDVQGGYTGTRNLNVDPRFIRMPSSGPDGTWGTPDDDYGDLGLQVGSPVINAGDNSTVPAGVSIDLRGNPRILGGTVDMGASEAVAPASSIWVSGNASLQIAGSRELELLRIDDQSRVEIAKGANAVVTIGMLLINGEGVLDVNDNTLVISGISEQEVAKLIRKGRGTGTWAGTGIVSSAAKTKPFTGLAAVPSGDGQVLIRYTWNGDANLDGTVNASDYFLIDSGFIKQPAAPRYRDGDFNYDGKSDASDYFLIDSAFIAQTGVLAAGKAPAQPEIAMVRRAEAASSWRAISVLQQLFSVKPIL